MNVLRKRDMTEKASNGLIFCGEGLRYLSRVIDDQTALEMSQKEDHQEKLLKFLFPDILQKLESCKEALRKVEELETTIQVLMKKKSEEREIEVTEPSIGEDTDELAEIEEFLESDSDANSEDDMKQAYIESDAGSDPESSSLPQDVDFEEESAEKKPHDIAKMQSEDLASSGLADKRKEIEKEQVKQRNLLGKHGDHVQLLGYQHDDTDQEDHGEQTAVHGEQKAGEAAVKKPLQVLQTKTYASTFAQSKARVTGSKRIRIVPRGSNEAPKRLKIGNISISATLGAQEAAKIQQWEYTKYTLKKNRICPHFTITGRCKFQEDCRYAHDEQYIKQFEGFDVRTVEVPADFQVRL